ncbi:MAG: glutathione-disulfide reductase [Proteobacteria bacterium]|nr:glutathione-disulfide reductase [Pseudomonadota bacterium]
MEQYDYDLFVIGAGSGGVRACRIAATLGARVGVAEERYFGGTCVNVGCVPKKLFSYAAHYHDDLEDARGFGWSSPGFEFSWETLIRNKDKEINRLKGIYKSILDNNEVTVYEARARIEGPHELCIEEERITAKYILLAVGGWPWIPDYPGSEFAISSNEVFSLDSLPESITVVGGGYIALEFASIFSRLGSQTSLVYRGDKLLRGFDEEIRDFISAEIGRHVDLKLEEDVVSISNDNNKLDVLLKSGTRISCDTVLSATGRRPMTANLGLENVAVQLSEHGAIVVDDQFQTAEPSIYAVGDAIDRIALTPVALAEGQIVARALFGGDDASMDYVNIPTAVFCHPNLATVGLTEQQALDKGMELDVYLATVKQLKHSLSGRDELSMIKLIVEKSSDRVIGLHLISPDAGELVQGFAVAMNCGARKVDFDRTIGIHPTLAEEFVTMRTRRKSDAL